MQPVGVLRKVDRLGRVLIPKHLRYRFQIQDQDRIEIFVESDCIVMRKHRDTCFFCGGSETMNYRGKYICEECFNTLGHLLND